MQAQRIDRRRKVRAGQKDRRRFAAVNLYIDPRLTKASRERAESLGLSLSQWVSFLMKGGLADGPQTQEEILAPRRLEQEAV
jgi:hypothetical protein